MPALCETEEINTKCEHLDVEQGLENVIKKDIADCRALRKCFINDLRFKEYFMRVRKIWKDNLEKVKDFTIKNIVLPKKWGQKETEENAEENAEEKRLGFWLDHQNQNYRNKKENSTVWKDPECKALWEDFINDERFNEYFMTHEEFWKYRLQKTKDFILKNKKIPNQWGSEDPEEKRWGNFLRHHNRNYRNEKYGVWSEPEFRALWEDFINDPRFKVYFEFNQFGNCKGPYFNL